MERDARAWIAALRSGHDRLAAFVDAASADDLAHPSMCSEWSVAQVLSHLGSGAEIGRATVTATPVDNDSVWARWNAMDPFEQASSFVMADEELVAWYEALSDDEVATVQVQLPFLPSPIDVAGAAGLRLSEIALHSWDVFAASDPERHHELELGDDVELCPASGGATAGELSLLAEALVRLVAGRRHPIARQARPSPARSRSTSSGRRPPATDAGARPEGGGRRP